jgi:hypothetical protein
MNTRHLLRWTALILAGVLAAQCAWLLIPAELQGGPDRLPTDPDAAAIAARHRDTANQAASIGAVRGDLWARSAFTYADLLWPGNDADAAFQQALRRADEDLDRTFDYAPSQSSAWLLLAGLTARTPSSGPKPTAALKMAYYTGPSDQYVVPLRLKIAAQSADFEDVEIQPLVMRDLRLLLARQDTSAIVEAYDAASAAGKKFIEQSLDTLDPAARKLLPGAEPDVH